MKALWPWESPVSSKSNSRPVPQPGTSPAWRSQLHLMKGPSVSGLAAISQKLPWGIPGSLGACLNCYTKNACGRDGECLWWEHHFSLDVQLETQCLKWKPQLPARRKLSPKVQGEGESDSQIQAEENMLRNSENWRRKRKKRLGTPRGTRLSMCRYKAHFYKPLTSPSTDGLPFSQAALHRSQTWLVKQKQVAGWCLG